MSSGPQCKSKLGNKPRNRSIHVNGSYDGKRRQKKKKKKKKRESQFDRKSKIDSSIETCRQWTERRGRDR